MSPLFILGNPRSGTTLLRLMLTCHPQLCVAPECGFVLWLQKSWGGWSAADSASDAAVSAFLVDLEASRKFDTWRLPVAAVRAEIERDPPSSYAALCDRVYRAWARSQGKPEARWGDKNNFHVSHVTELDALFPTARFLHIVRDGRDVACSYIQVMDERPDGAYAPRLPVDVARIAEEWRDNNDRVERDLSRLAPDRHQRIRYEDLVRDARPELTRVCTWLGIEFVADMLRSDQSNRALGLEPVELLAWKRRTLVPPDATGVGRYRTDLSPEQVNTFNELAGNTLRTYGYTDVTEDGDR
jgi:hypothetical protein